jgi:hypothetical protein
LQPNSFALSFKDIAANSPSPVLIAHFRSEASPDSERRPGVSLFENAVHELHVDRRAKIPGALLQISPPAGA